MNFCISTDSGQVCPFPYCQQHAITVLPLGFTMEGRTYPWLRGHGQQDFL